MGVRRWENSNGSFQCDTGCVDEHVGDIIPRIWSAPPSGLLSDVWYHMWPCPPKLWVTILLRFRSVKPELFEDISNECKACIPDEIYWWPLLIRTYVGSYMLSPLPIVWIDPSASIFNWNRLTGSNSFKVIDSLLLTKQRWGWCY